MTKLSFQKDFHTWKYLNSSQLLLRYARSSCSAGSENTTRIRTAVNAVAMAGAAISNLPRWEKRLLFIQLSRSVGNEHIFRLKMLNNNVRQSVGM